MAFTISDTKRIHRRGGVLSRIVTYTFTDSVGDDTYDAEQIPQNNF